MRTILATRCALALTILALAPFARAGDLQVGQAVAAEWSEGRYYEGTVKAIDGGNVVVAWKDGSEASPVAAEKVVAVPKNEKHDATVGAFYLSNVEQYLYQDRIWGNFCRNVATLPLLPSSTFIRSVRGGGGGPGGGLNSELGSMSADVKDCGASGQ